MKQACCDYLVDNKPEIVTKSCVAVDDRKRMWHEWSNEDCVVNSRNTSDSSTGLDVNDINSVDGGECGWRRM